MSSPLVSLSALLAEPDEPVQYRIDGLLPVGGRVVLAAQYKAGKTTMRDNLVRSLADGAPFLDHFTVARPAGSIVVLDDEMSRSQIRRWMGDQGIVNTDRVQVAVLRGRVASFGILDSEIRAGWAAELQRVSASFVIFDCLRPVIDALGLDEARDAGKLLVAFDALLREAGVSEAVVIHHMGHSGERSRGDSRIRDWPDVEWRLVRQADDDGAAEPNAPRFFTAYGRDVDVAEGAITFDPNTRRLSYTAGSRKESAIVGAYDAVISLLAEATEPLSGRGIEEPLLAAGHSRKAIRAAIDKGVTEGTVTRESGPRRAQLHRLSGVSAPVRRSAPGELAQSVSECASAYIGALHSHTTEGTVRHDNGGALDPPDICAVDGCESKPRNKCWTCATHMAEELTHRPGVAS